MTSSAVSSGGNANPARDLAQPRRRVLVRGLIIGLFVLWAGVPTSILDQPTYLGRQIAAALILLALPLCILTRRIYVSGWWIIIPLILFSYFFSVSYIANPNMDWIFASYDFVPLLAVVLLIALRPSVADVLYALMWAGWFAAAIVFIDSFFHLPFMDAFQRVSTFSAGFRRVVLMKDTIALSFILTAALVITDERPVAKLARLAAPLAVTAYVLLFVLESRLALGSIAVTLVLFMITTRLGEWRKFLVWTVGLAALVPVGSSVFSRYLIGFGDASYLEKYNVAVRTRSLSYYMEAFSQTNGLGFGILSPTGQSGIVYLRVQKLSYNFADLGVAGALVQFGYIGLFMTVAMTIFMASIHVQTGRRLASREAPLLIATGCFVFGSMLSPVPVSYFTMSWCLPLGITLWYLAYQARQEGLLAKRL